MAVHGNAVERLHLRRAECSLAVGGQRRVVPGGTTYSVQGRLPRGRGPRVRDRRAGRRAALPNSVCNAALASGGGLALGLVLIVLTGLVWSPSSLFHDRTPIEQGSPAAGLCDCHHSRWIYRRSGDGPLPARLVSLTAGNGATMLGRGEERRWRSASPGVRLAIVSAARPMRSKMRLAVLAAGVLMGLSACAASGIHGQVDTTFHPSEEPEQVLLAQLRSRLHGGNWRLDTAASD